MGHIIPAGSDFFSGRREGVQKCETWIDGFPRDVVYFIHETCQSEETAMYRTITLSNGARLLTEYIPGARSAALGFFVGAAPATNAPQKTARPILLSTSPSRVLTGALPPTWPGRSTPSAARSTLTPPRRAPATTPGVWTAIWTGPPTCCAICCSTPASPRRMWSWSGV